MVPFKCDSEREALDIAAGDTSEFRVAKVVRYTGTPDTRDFRIVVIFSGMPHQEHPLRFRDIKHLELAKKFIRTTPELRTLVKQLDVEPVTSKRITKQSRYLTGEYTAT